MAKHHTYGTNRAKRLQAVSQLKLRYGWNSREIGEELAKHEDLHNPGSGKPWDDSTIRGDLRFLEAEWKAEARKNMAAIQEEHLRAIREARAAAWQQGDMANVLRALAQESELLGINEPEKKEITGKNGTPVGFPPLKIILSGESDAQSNAPSETI